VKCGKKTSWGDAVNITARLASNASQGEVLVSEAAYTAAGLQSEGLEKRDLTLMGKSESLGVSVLHPR